MSILEYKLMDCIRSNSLFEKIERFEKLANEHWDQNYNIYLTVHMPKNIDEEVQGDYEYTIQAIIQKHIDAIIDKNFWD